MDFYVFFVSVLATWFFSSFFNIFKAGSGAAPHRHLKSQDKKFDLWKHKYSLVYYVDPGDQNCDQPGTLKMHAPEIEILPKKGMILMITTRAMRVAKARRPMRALIAAKAIRTMRRAQ